MLRPCLATAVVVAVLSLTPAATGATPATGATQDGPPLTSCTGQPLNHTVHPGQCVLVTATGFAAREPVRIRLASTASRHTVQRADRAGIIRYRLQLGDRIGPDVLTLVGLNPGAAGDAGTVSVSVPRFAVVRYRVSKR